MELELTSLESGGSCSSKFANQMPLDFFILKCIGSKLHSHRLEKELKSREKASNHLSDVKTKKIISLSNPNLKFCCFEKAKNVKTYLGF